MNKIVSTPEKLAVVERLCEEFRWARNVPEAPEHITLTALRAIASDIRARMDEAPSIAEANLENRINACANGGLTTPRLVALAHEVMKRWPVIKQALAKFGAEEHA